MNERGKWEEKECAKDLKRWQCGKKFNSLLNIERLFISTMKGVESLRRTGNKYKICLVGKWEFKSMRIS